MSSSAEARFGRDRAAPLFHQRNASGIFALALSASFGVSGWLAADQHSDNVLRRADNAMYAAKSQGRNCVVLLTA